MGIGLAATGVIASGFFHITWADGAASVAVGLLLISVAWVLANETRSLIAGEAVAPIVMERLKEALRESTASPIWKTSLPYTLVLARFWSRSPLPSAAIPRPT